MGLLELMTKYHTHTQGRGPRQYETNSTTWRKLRAYVLQLQPLCACGCRKPADTVDHIDGNAMNNAMSNLQGMAAACHSRKTATMDGGFGNRPRGAIPRGCDVNGNPFGRSDW